MQDDDDNDDDDDDDDDNNPHKTPHCTSRLSHQPIRVNWFGVFASFLHYLDLNLAESSISLKHLPSSSQREKCRKTMEN